MVRDGRRFDRTVLDHAVEIRSDGFGYGNYCRCVILDIYSIISQVS
jgi:hypothetical protein